MTRATVQDVHELARSMPGAELVPGGKVVYQVRRKSFVFFRNPRPDAVDPDTGERYDDVIVFWVASDADKQALLADESTPFFTTPHFNGHPSVLLRGAGSASSTATSSPRSCTTRGSLGPRSGWRGSGWTSAGSPPTS